MVADAGERLVRFELHVAGSPVIGTSLSCGGRVLRRPGIWESRGHEVGGGKASALRRLPLGSSPWIRLPVFAVRSGMQRRLAAQQDHTGHRKSRGVQRPTKDDAADPQPPDLAGELKRQLDGQTDHHRDEQDDGQTVT